MNNISFLKSIYDKIPKKNLEENLHKIFLDVSTPKKNDDEFSNQPTQKTNTNKEILRFSFF